MSTSPISNERAQEILNVHNCHRARFGVAPLTWDWNLAKDALVHTQKCVFAHSTDRNNQGENLAIAWGKPVNIDGWIQEEADWNCGKGLGNGDCQPGKVCGHWTQVIWSGSTKVGCAISKCPDGSELLNCRYSPAGNYVGEPPFDASKCSGTGANCSNPSGSSFSKPSVPVDQSFTNISTSTMQQKPIQQVQKNQQNQQNEYQYQEPEPVQQKQEPFMNLFGLQVYYETEERKQIVSQLTKENQYRLAKSLQQIEPQNHANAIDLFIVTLKKETGVIKTLYARADQREALDKLSTDEYNELWSFIRPVPTDPIVPSEQHCLIEKFLLEKNLTHPSMYCGFRKESNDPSNKSTQIIYATEGKPSPLLIEEYTPPSQIPSMWTWSSIFLLCIMSLFVILLIVFMVYVIIKKVFGSQRPSSFRTNRFR